LTALGIILKQGPCLAHAVVTQFAGSSTYAYRSGAGSVYPLLKRLAEAGYLDYGNRKYSLTETGRDAIREWVRPPFEPGDFSTNLDVLRSRAYFLRLLSSEELEEFLTGARNGLEILLSECETSVRQQRESGDRFGEMAALGSVYETKARISWISELGQLLK
jgi:DNA-binding PadR family transcriptional regulator